MCHCPANTKVEIGLKETFASQQRDKICQCQINWLVLNGYAHNITQPPEFAAMFHVYDPTFKPIARLTYVEGITAMFTKMIKGIKNLSDECRRDMGDLGNWLSIIHDIWTSLTTDGILGSSLKLTTRNMDTYTIAAVLEKNNVSHGAKDVAAQLQTAYQNRYNIDLIKEAGNVGGDTTPCAHNVGENLDAYQRDCEMHVIALIILYGSGWKENTKTVTVTDALVCISV